MPVFAVITIPANAQLKVLVRPERAYIVPEVSVIPEATIAVFVAVNVMSATPSAYIVKLPPEYNILTTTCIFLPFSSSERLSSVRIVCIFFKTLLISSFVGAFY